MGLRHLAAVAASQCVLLALCASSASASLACPDDQTQPTMATAPQAAAALVCDIDVVRVREGLRPLRWDWRLWNAAQDMAADMGRRHFFSHVTPDGVNLLDRVRPTGYLADNNPDWVLSENLAWGSGAVSTPLAIVFGWLNSEGHRRNLLDPAIEEVGIGMFDAAPAGHDGGMIYVADFGTRGRPVITAARAQTAPRSRRHRARG